MQIISCNQIKWCFYSYFCPLLSNCRQHRRNRRLTNWLQVGGYYADTAAECECVACVCALVFCLFPLQVAILCSTNFHFVPHISPEGIRYVCDWQISILRANKSARKWNIPAHAHDNNGSLETNEENIRQSSSFIQCEWCACVCGCSADRAEEKCMCSYAIPMDTISEIDK